MLAISESCQLPVSEGAGATAGAVVSGSGYCIGRDLRVIVILLLILLAASVFK